MLTDTLLRFLSNQHNTHIQLYVCIDYIAFSNT